MTHVETGNTAPRFSLKALDGKSYSLDSLLERGPVVLAFFKISCPVCQFTFPFLQRISERFSGKSISIVGISQDDARSTKEFNREYGVTFLTLVDDDGYPASNAYGLTNVPTVFLIAPDGKVKVSCVGFDKAALETIANELAQHQRVSSAPLFRPDEIIPAFKPG
ncbi:MAG: TlpA disulfide reductase family protein [Candidatus Acidiferrum sp.]